ncbi:MAG: lipopolysaccharide biosynthesis protein, partial [Burkholderiales bacterium]|nr:lipopolysaccharide biosynthesis protein [Burkholderiales bacterium]
MTEPSNSPATYTTVEDDEISLLDLLIVLAKHKKLILGLPFFVAILAAIYSLFMPISYTATTKILPPLQGQSSASAMLAQLGGLAGLAAGAAANPSDVYVAMLKSRTVADNLIERFGLAQIYGGKYPSQVREKLTRATSIGSSKDGIITIQVGDGDPKRAADVANAYVDELEKLSQVLAVTEASRRRLFFERQFAQAKDNLAKAEAAAGRA